MTEPPPDDSVSNPGTRDESQRAALPPVVAASIVGTFVILLLGALYYARSFVLPIVLAILLALSFAPAVRILSRRGLPPALAAILIVVALAAAAIGMSAALSGPIAGMVEEAPAVVAEIRERFAPLARPFARLNRMGHEVETMTDGVEAGAGQQEVVIAQPGLISWAGKALADIGTTLAATLVLTPFLLASRDSLRQKLVRIRPRFSGRKQALHVFGDIESEISRYLLTITTINAGLGVLVGTSMAILGMPSPLLWAVGAALLNFIPFVGATIGILLAAGVAVVTFDSLAVAALPPLAYIAAQVIEGSLITPLALGRRLDLNVVAILIALALTTWMWGIIGAVIGVPLLVVMKVFSDRIPSLAPFSILLSADRGTNNGRADEAEDAPPSPGQPPQAG
jgi:predicted PurR-regulated permease PerM